MDELIIKSRHLSNLHLLALKNNKNNYHHKADELIIVSKEYDT